MEYAAAAPVAEATPQNAGATRQNLRLALRPSEHSEGRSI